MPYMIKPGKYYKTNSWENYGDYSNNLSEVDVLNDIINNASVDNPDIAELWKSMSDVEKKALFSNYSSSFLASSMIFC